MMDIMDEWRFDQALKNANVPTFTCDNSCAWYEDCKCGWYTHDPDWLARFKQQRELVTVYGAAQTDDVANQIGDTVLSFIDREYGYYLGNFAENWFKVCGLCTKLCGDGVTTLLREHLRKQMLAHIVGLNEADEFLRLVKEKIGECVNNEDYARAAFLQEEVRSFC
jgi:hypothetical protein